jgi:hypothetical protein
MRYVNDVVQTTSQRIVLAFGLWFTFGNYVAGTLLWPDTITDPNAMHMTKLLGFIPVMINGWHLYFHLLTGLACLMLATSRRRALTAGLLVGGIYVVTGVSGLLLPGDIFGFIMADTFGNWVHLTEGAGLLATALGARSAINAETTAAVQGDS